MEENTTNIIVAATSDDRDEILKLYKLQLGREYCPWDEHYPGAGEIDYDLSRNALFVMKEKDGRIIASVSIDKDDNVEALGCWSPELAPGGELSRLAVHPECQNRGIAVKMLAAGMEELKKHGYRSIHFLVNKNNLKAIKSYNKLEFNIVGECDLYEQPFLCYEKKLV